jgi:hypothetical protein
MDRSSEVEMLRRDVAALREEVAALRAELAARPQWSRRAVLGAGAAAAAVGGALGPASPAAADVGDPVYQGITNSAGAFTTRLNSSSVNAAFMAVNSSPAIGLRGEAAGGGDGTQGWSTSGRGVYGFSSTGHGVWGETTGVNAAVYGYASGSGGGVVGIAGSGYGVYGQSNSVGVYGRGGLYGMLAEGTGAVAARFANVTPGVWPPTSGSYSVGMVSAQANGSLWVCVESGTPGVWRQLASPASAGAFVPITPARVFDSRYLAPVGRLAAGANRTVSVANSYLPDSATVATANVVPSGATAVAVNLTVTDTTGSGYLFLAPGTATAVTASSINWTAPGTTVANAVVVPLDTARQLKAFVGGGGSAHFLLDVSGYYR